MAEPNYSSYSVYTPNERLNKLIRIMDEQQEDLVVLQKMVSDVLREKSMQDAVTGNPLTSRHRLSLYNEEIDMILNRHYERVMEIDHLINENIYSIKKGETSNKIVLIYGKEARKIEMNFRELKRSVRKLLTSPVQHGEGEMINVVRQLSSGVSDKVHSFQILLRRNVSNV